MLKAKSMEFLCKRVMKDLMVQLDDCFKAWSMYLYFRSKQHQLSTEEVIFKKEAM